ncbi:hypothetical protein HAX54_042725 [Datura stramonium]|uniref:Uncharacterized protein n=1 Tax=Datura stramonium TaxID=4076 RepID=A0ABS8VZV0_DATST|nr:hypothetical protein [Datura stramonium]
MQILLVMMKLVADECVEVDPIVKGVIWDMTGEVRALSTTYLAMPRGKIKVHENLEQCPREILDTEHVEVEPEETMSGTLYANGDYSGESIEEDAMEIEVSSQSFVLSKIITDSKQILKVGGAKDQIDEKVDCEDTYGMIFGSFEAAKQSIEELKRESGGGSYADAKAS